MSESAYGGCEGPEAEYVKLISSDQHEFIIKKEHALTSGTIKVIIVCYYNWHLMIFCRPCYLGQASSLKMRRMR